VPAFVDEPVADLPATAFRDVVVVGGGCYGTFYSGQLAAALARGKITARSIVLVDRNPDCQAARDAKRQSPFRLVIADWDHYLDGFLDHPPPEVGDPDDAIVPSPLMPHLMAEWLLGVAGRLRPDREVSLVPVDQPVGTPYDVHPPGANRFVSFADWLCPTHCIEPHVCPITGGPRTWEMSDALTAYVARVSRTRPMAGPALFVTRHRAHGVGMFDVSEARSARSLLVGALGEPGQVELLVATISSCHGAVSCLRVGPPGSSAGLYLGHQ